METAQAFLQNADMRVVQVDVLGQCLLRCLEVRIQDRLQGSVSLPSERQL